MSTAVDYIGRRFDVLSMRGVTERGEVRLNQSLFDASSKTIFDAVHGGEVCTGVQKLAQRWALEFLTEKGTMGFHLKNRGSEFIKWYRSGRLRTEFDVQAYFNFAAQQVRSNLVNEEPDDMPADERLGLANLDSLSIAAGYLSLHVTVTSVAGTSRKVILPITIVPSNIRI